jgi:hypothetical protein
MTIEDLTPKEFRRSLQLIIGSTVLVMTPILFYGCEEELRIRKRYQETKMKAYIEQRVK